MAKGKFTVYILASPNDRNPKNIGNVEGSGEDEVMRAAISLIRRKMPHSEIFGCGVEAIEYGGERRQYAGIVL